MLHRACERAGFDVAYFAERLPQLPARVRREREPTLKQLEKPARLTRTPEAKPSPDLLDTLYTMQRGGTFQKYAKRLGVDLPRLGH